MILELLLPFIRKFRGHLWHDTIELIIPPLPRPVIVEYYASPDKPAIIFALYPGNAHEYDPATGTVGPEIRTMDAGFYHYHEGWMKRHVDPLVESFLSERPYQFVGYLKPGKPHVLEMYNRTDKFIWFDVTIWVAEFEREQWIYNGRTYSLEELLDMYLSKIADLIMGWPGERPWRT